MANDGSQHWIADVLSSGSSTAADKQAAAAAEAAAQRAGMGAGGSTYFQQQPQYSQYARTTLTAPGGAAPGWGAWQAQAQQQQQQAAQQQAQAQAYQQAQALQLWAAHSVQHGEVAASGVSFAARLRDEVRSARTLPVARPA